MMTMPTKMSATPIKSLMDSMLPKKIIPDAIALAGAANELIAAILAGNLLAIEAQQSQPIALAMTET